MKNTLGFAATIAILIAAPLIAIGADKPQVKPLAGPRATILRETPLYVAPDTTSQKVDRIQEGRELVVAETSGPWVRVFANTDVEEVDERDAPVFGREEAPPPVSGWMQARGIVRDTTEGGDRVLMGEAASMEILAEDARGPRNAGHAARLLYRRLVEFFPTSPLAAEAAWRAADIRWQFEKADVSKRPSAKEREAYLREQLYEDEMKKVIKLYPHSKQADMAAFELIDNKLCGDWQGQEKCPEKESAYYEKFASEYPSGPRTAQALYQATYRQAVLKDMYAADSNDKKSDAAASRAKQIAAQLQSKFPESDYTSRAAALVYKLEQGIAVYGSDRD
ncbi:tetratricopeptide repeat protein [Acidicapsa ligni]|uniref:tetratricopeptide repeat protein n=1 Tax=Acidicapsa ligni TaxID=542300 RepID=UPI0021E08FC8|nr:outer membrane protein assembly factor BamD [Acidicapsa ligni]